MACCHVVGCKEKPVFFVRDLVSHQAYYFCKYHSFKVLDVVHGCVKGLSFDFKPTEDVLDDAGWWSTV